MFVRWAANPAKHHTEASRGNQLEVINMGVSQHRNTEGAVLNVSTRAPRQYETVSGHTQWGAKTSVGMTTSSPGQAEPQGDGPQQDRAGVLGLTCINNVLFLKLNYEDICICYNSFYSYICMKYFIIKIGKGVNISAC